MNLQTIDEDGQTIGEIDKIAAHQNGGVWHRAISVFLFNSAGQLLIQQRAQSKYHFAGLWANSCCSHPEVGESIEQAAARAMMVELGVQTDVKEVGVVRYEAHDPISGRTEREHDHILVGQYNGEFFPDPEEVSSLGWVDLPLLKLDIEQNPERFAPWLPIILDSGLI